MKISKRFVIGTRNNTSLSNEKPPLSFMVATDKEEVSEKDIITLRKWCGYTYSGVEMSKTILNKFENTLTEGFKIDTVVSRYSTSNKLFRLIDPRGFMVEISSDNLCEILKSSSIDRGNIMGKCIWAGKYLVHENSPTYKEVIKESVKVKKPDKGLTLTSSELEIGRNYVLSRGKIGPYFGQFEGYYVFGERCCYGSSTEITGMYKAIPTINLIGNTILDFKKSVVRHCDNYKSWKSLRPINTWSESKHALFNKLAPKVLEKYIEDLKIYG